jgi:LysR family transcriptional activator of nhaA
VREGQSLVLTECGRLGYQHAEEIFSTGREVMDTLRGRPTKRPAKLLVGIFDVVSKLVAYRLLETALNLPSPAQLILFEGKTDVPITPLGLQKFEMVLTDMPVHSKIRVKAFNYPLGSSDIGFFAAPSRTKKYGANFPLSLDGAPLLLPIQNAELRHSLTRWFDEIGVYPEVVAEIEDTALTKVFCRQQRGIFAAPMMLIRLAVVSEQLLAGVVEEEIPEAVAGLAWPG